LFRGACTAFFAPLRMRAAPWGGNAEISGDSLLFSVILKLQFWATCCRARRGIILLNIAHPYRVIICCGWCACARVELNCLFLHWCSCVLSAERDRVLAPLRSGNYVLVWIRSRGVLSNTLFVLAKHWLQLWSRVTFITRTLKFDTAELWIPKIHLHLYFSTVLLTAPSYAQPSSLAGWRFLFLHSTSSLHSLRTPVRLHFSHASLCICTLKWHGTVFCEHSCMQFAFFLALLSCTCVCVYAITK